MLSPVSELRSPPSEQSWLTRQSEAGDLVAGEEVVGRFQEVCRVTKLALDWDTRVMKDLVEDLKLLMGAQGTPKPQERETPESFFANLRQVLTQAKSQINSLCFKCRGKYSEAECRKGVGQALEKLGGEVWKRVDSYLQCDYNGHLSAALCTALDLQRKAESVRTQLSKAQIGFEDFLKRCLMTTPPPDSSINSPLFSPRQTTNASYVSDSVDTESISSEMADYSEKLVKTLQKLAKGGPRDGFPQTNRKEVDRLLRDIAKTVRTSREEAGKISKEIREQRLQRYVISLRSRASALLREMDAVAALPTSQDIISGLQQDITSLEAVIVSQAGEIRFLKESLQSPLDENFQSTILTEVKELKGLVETSIRKNSADEDMTQALALLRASAPLLKATSEAELIEKYCDQAESLRSTVNALLTKLMLNDVSVTSLEAVADLTIAFKRESESLAVWKAIQEGKLKDQQSHYELEIEYLERRLRELESKEKYPSLSVPDSPTMRLETVSSMEDGLSLGEDRSRLQEALHRSAEELFAYRELYGSLPEDKRSAVVWTGEEDEDALGLDLGISLELLKGRKQDALSTLERLLGELQALGGLKRKAKKELVVRMVDLVKELTAGYVHEFAQLRKLEGDLSRMEQAVKSQKASVRFREG